MERPSQICLYYTKGGFDHHREVCSDCLWNQLVCLDNHQMVEQ